LDLQAKQQQILLGYGECCACKSITNIYVCTPALWQLDALCPAISLEFTSGAITVSAALRHAWITGQTQKHNRYRDEYQAEAQMQTLLHWCNGAGNDRFDIIRRTTPPSQRIQHKRDMLYSRYGKEGAQLSPGWYRHAWLAP
jgi:hypothetical protein